MAKILSIVLTLYSLGYALEYFECGYTGGVLKISGDVNPK